MAAIQSLRTALHTLRRRPVLFVAGLIYAFVVLPQTALSLMRVPLVPYLLQLVTFFITPFVIAGLYGMAHEALDGDTDFGTLVATGKRRYVPLLLGKLLEWVITVAFGVLLVIALLVFAFVIAGVGATAGSLDSGAIGATTLAIGGVLLLMFGTIWVVIRVLIQFFPVAICTDDFGPFGGFKQSVRLAREQPKSVLGFTLLNGVVFLVASIPFSAYFIWQFVRRMGFGPAGIQREMAGMASRGVGLSPFSLPELAALVAVSFVLKILLRTYFQTYATAFYHRHRPTADEGGTPPTDESGGDEHVQDSHPGETPTGEDTAPA